MDYAVGQAFTGLWTRSSRRWRCTNGVRATPATGTRSGRCPVDRTPSRPTPNSACCAEIGAAGGAFWR